MLTFVKLHSYSLKLNFLLKYCVSISLSQDNHNDLIRGISSYLTFKTTKDLKQLFSQTEFCSSGLVNWPLRVKSLQCPWHFIVQACAVKWQWMNLDTLTVSLHGVQPMDCLIGSGHHWLLYGLLLFGLSFTCRHWHTLLSPIRLMRWICCL